MNAIVPVVLLLAFLFLSLMITEALAFIPLSLIYHIHLPQWLGLGILAALLAWLVGD